MFQNLLKLVKSRKIKLAVTIITILWDIFLLTHTLLSTRLWLWNLTSFIPPVFFLIINLILLLKNLILQNKLGLIIAIILIPLTLANTDINMGVLKKHKTSKTNNQLTVFNWNTQFWESENLDEFYKFLQDQEADIYLLQEHYFEEAENDYYLSDEEELANYFSEYNISIKNEFITMSKYPIQYSYGDKDKTYLRTDLDINGQTITFFNVHMPLQLYYPLVSQPIVFMKNVRYRFFLRSEKFDILEREIAACQNLYYIGGDFNTTKSMHNMDHLLSQTTDSYSVTNTLFPTTWEAFGLKLWRIDYNLASEGITIVSHENVNPKSFSDHSAQKVVIGT